MGRRARSAAILSLVAILSGVLVYDRITRSAADTVDMSTPTTVYATSTANPPHPATGLSHPQHP